MRSRHATTLRSTCRTRVRALVVVVVVAAATSLNAVLAADAPRPPATNTPIIESAEGAVESADRRYRIVGSVSPASTPAPERAKAKAKANATDRAPAKNGYRLEGGIVGFASSDDEIERKTASTISAKSASRRPASDALINVLSHWGACATAEGTGCAGDLDADGFVGPEDLIAAIHGEPR